MWTRTPCANTVSAMSSACPLSAGHPYRWLCACTSETLRTNAFAWNVHRDFQRFRVVFLNIIEWSVVFERRVLEWFALLYERLWSFSFHPFSFWSPFVRSWIFQYLELVLHFPPVHFGPLYYLVLLIPVLHFQSTQKFCFDFRRHKSNVFNCHTFSRIRFV